MTKIQQDLLNSTAYNYFQFKKQFPNRESLLFSDIMSVLECSEAIAEKFGATHCNMLSFWNGNFSQAKTSMPYRDFYDNMLENNFCNKEGYFKVDKDVVCDEIFGFEFKIEYFEDYNDVLKPLTRLDPECCYQLKMKGDTSGFHFIICYIDKETGLLMGADTSYRGTPFVVAKKITQKNFVWLLKI